MNTIILEGPDGSGKSTLAERLRRRGYRVHPFGVPPAAARRSEATIFDFFFEPLVSYTAPTGGKDKNVFDRLHLSDAVYGAAVRNEHVMTPRAQALIERYVEAIDGQLVICLPPYRVAFNNWLRRKGAEYVKKAETYARIYDGYARLLLSPRNRRWVWYDYTRYTATSLVNALVAVRGYPLPAGVVGSQRPRFLFVGEGPKKGTRDLPFLTPRNCSGWLYDRIAAAGYEEDEVAFVNALGPDREEKDLAPIVAELEGRGLQRIVALGQVAARAVARVRPFKFDSVDHPQHRKRFHAAEAKKYSNYLREIRRKTK